MKTYKIYLGKHPLFNTTKPLLMGEFEGSSFKEACRGYFEEKAKNTPNNINLYEEDKGEFWGTKVYETEEEAMSEFGSPEKEIRSQLVDHLLYHVKQSIHPGVYMNFDRLKDLFDSAFDLYKITLTEQP